MHGVRVVAEPSGRHHASGHKRTVVRPRAPSLSLDTALALTPLERTLVTFTTTFWHGALEFAVVARFTCNAKPALRRGRRRCPGAVDRCAHNVGRHDVGRNKFTGRWSRGGSQSR